MLQPPLSHPTPPPSCVQFAPPIVQLLLLAAEYTLMLILLLAVFMCSLWFLVHREFPYCHHPTTLSIRAPPPAPPPSHPATHLHVLLPPPSALLPILGDPGAVLKVPHTPEAVSGPLPSHERNTQ